MADELNISYQHYKKIENGSHGCSIEVLLDISSVFDVSTDYLLTGRTFEPLRIQKQLSEAQDILSDIMKDLNQASDYRM
jgi:transcriptional regulator with XRE-family HTH domain